MPRDRKVILNQASQKEPRRMPSVQDKIIHFYLQGLSTPEIRGHLNMMLMSPATLISKITDAVIDQVVEWQSRPLEPGDPIVYLVDCVVLKIRQDKQSYQQNGLSCYRRIPRWAEGIVWGMAWPSVSEVVLCGDIYTADIVL